MVSPDVQAAWSAVINQASIEVWRRPEPRLSIVEIYSAFMYFGAMLHAKDDAMPRLEQCIEECLTAAGVTKVRP